MTTECKNCGKPTRDAAYSCDDCLGKLSIALGEIPWADRELLITESKQRAAGAADGSRSTEKPLPYNVAAHEARRHLKATLVTWVKFCDEERVRHSSPSNAWPVDNLPSLSRWLMWRVDGLGLHELGGDAVDEITGAVAACRRVIDLPPERRYAGRCGCGKDLYHRPGATEVSCSTCGLIHDVAALYEWMKSQVRGQLVTARDGADWLCKFGMETQQGTIDKWAERKRVVVKGHDQKKRRLYLFDDLLELAGKSAARGVA